MASEPSGCRKGPRLGRGCPCRHPALAPSPQARGAPVDQRPPLPLRSAPRHAIQPLTSCSSDPLRSQPKSAQGHGSALGLVDSQEKSPPTSPRTACCGYRPVHRKPSTGSKELTTQFGLYLPPRPLFRAQGPLQSQSSQGAGPGPEEKTERCPRCSLARNCRLRPDIWFLFHTPVVTLHNKQMIRGVTTRLGLSALGLPGAAQRPHSPGPTRPPAHNSPVNPAPPRISSSRSAFKREGQRSCRGLQLTSPHLERGLGRGDKRKVAAEGAPGFPARGASARPPIG